MEIFVLIRIPSLEKSYTQSQNFSGMVPSVFLISPHTSSFMPWGLSYVLFLIYIVGNCECVTSDQWAAHSCRVMLVFYLFFILAWEASCSKFLKSLSVRHPWAAGLNSGSESLWMALAFRAGSPNPTWWCFDDLSNGGCVMAWTAVKNQVNFMRLWREKPTGSE